MQELFPLMAGAVVGALVLAIRPQWLRVVAFVAGCVVFGVAASWISGELEESWGFLSVDMLLVWFGGLAAVTLITGIRHRETIRQMVFKSPKDSNRG
jgi:hypothetical protein